MSDQLERLRSALHGRYELDRQIGEGGMATVYRARDLKIDRAVAIKVLRPELSASLGADRFLREIRVAGSLQHPNILGLYDSGETDRLLYYVMPFVEGESLRDRLNREQQLPLSDALQIVREAAEALQYAHQRGIVHRDIKPENILLLGSHALVADFGIARAVTQAGGDRLTQTGMAVGTPHYMSPEQSLGSEHVDARSDIYSLGCVLYEVLIGQPPFTGPNAMAIMARHSMEVVPRLQVVRPSVPDDVEDAVMRALEKTPADRFQTMKEFCECLTEAEAEATVARTSARRAATGARRVATQVIPAAAPHPGRNRAMVIGGVIAALLIIGGGAWAGLRHKDSGPSRGMATDGPDAHRVAVLYFDSPAGQDSLRYLASGLTEGLIGQLREVQTLDVISPNGVAPYRDSTLPRDSLAKALNVGTLVQGDVEKDADRVRVTVRLVDAASGADFQRASFEQRSANIAAIQDTLVQQVARLIRQRLGEEIKVRTQQAGTSNPQAWLLVQQAEQARRNAEERLAQKDTSGAVARNFDRADSVYAVAASLDPRWVEPVLGRGWVAFRRSRLVGLDPLAAKPWIDKGEQFAGSALAMDQQNPDALQLRGELRYWSWLLTLEPDPAKAKALLQAAQADLEAAVKIRPSQAGAWAALSHLYNQTGGETDAKLAARRAYEEDAYLSNADVILMRLFLASYDLSQFVDADRWCAEGQRRFPTDFKFVKCRLWMLTTRAQEPDANLAWRLADSVGQIAPAPRRAFETLEGRMLAAIVLARKGLADSAKAVARRSRGDADVDATRDLRLDDAYVHLLAGDKAEALNSLKLYLAANPERRAGMAEDAGWWFRSLQDDPAFQQMVSVR